MKNQSYATIVQNIPNLEPKEGENQGIIISRERERYVLATTQKIMPAEISGRFLTTAGIADFPVVGDYVSFLDYESMAIILDVAPRKNLLKRKSVKAQGQIQPIAANLDSAFIVTSADRDFNPNRLDRYLSIVLDSGITPLILITKCDLLSSSELSEIENNLGSRFPGVQFLFTSALNSEGIVRLREFLKKGKLYCFIGSSGVGKSTLLNLMLGEDVASTNSISESTQKGKHTTTRRELFVLPDGACIIDTPGMRELGVGDAEEGIELTFGEISRLAKSCKFSDCHHVDEPGCAVLEGLEKGEITAAQFNNYHKLKREAQRHTEDALEKKRKVKEFGRMVKEAKSYRKKYKY